VISLFKKMDENKARNNVPTEQ